MSGKFPTETSIPDLTRPNFGEHDDDVAATKASIELAESMHESTLHASFSHA
jgi:hypothetical protein